MGEVCLDAAASNASTEKPLTGNALLTTARRSLLSFASTQQAALIQCPAGYATMDDALSKPWLSRQLLKAVLPPESAWRIRLLQGMPTCGRSKDSSSDVCVHFMSVLSGQHGQLGSWLLPNTSLSVVQAYCRQAFASPPSSAVPPASVEASCDKVSKETNTIRRQQAAQRKALAIIWYLYVIFLSVGFLALQLYWRLPQRRKRGARSRGDTWLAKIASRLGHMLCPSVPEYRPGLPQAPRAGAAPAACWGQWHQMVGGVHRQSH